MRLVGCGFYGLPPPDTPRKVDTVRATTAAPDPPGDKGVQVGIPADGQSHLLPSEAMSREDDQLHQPTSGGHHFSNQQGHWPPPHVKSVRPVHSPEGDYSGTPWHCKVQEKGGEKTPPSIPHCRPGSNGDGVPGTGPGD